ncbi:MAG TPA: glycosyltransferase [Anaerolineae bacterium]|nr:glycosyltransferase [Anaerolineae bacterium]
MLTSVPVGTRSIKEYEHIVDEEIIEKVRQLGKDMKGARILNISSTAFGGGVAELLYTLVPLMRDVGLDADWQVIPGSENFFTITKLFHNALQGMDLIATPKMIDTYLKQNENNADLFDGTYDIVMVHDPQPASMLSFLKEKGKKTGKWIWRCHIDLTAAKQSVWGFLEPYLQQYDAAVFTMPQYIKNDFSVDKIAIVPPTIDPLSSKNIDISQETIDSVLERYHIDKHRPILSQVSRFDPWKDPLGVIDAYRIAKKEFPEVQLLMIASMATDDPEGFHYYEKTFRHAGGDPDIYLLSNLEGVGNLEVNAFQRASQIVIQKSTREGFGLVVSEALWKERPVIGGDVGGIPLQVINGKDGFLVSSSEQCGKKVIEILSDPNMAHEMGQFGKEHVRKNFLSPRQLADYMELFNSLDQSGKL